MNRVLVSFLIALALVAVRPLTASTAAEIVVSVPDQTLSLLDGKKCCRIIAFLLPSSAMATMLAVIAHRSARSLLPENSGTVYRWHSDKKSRAHGRSHRCRCANRDAIISRVIWLRGMERQNSTAHDRCIYIHGTPEERHIGKPFSFGCIRMRSWDVIALYDSVHIGMQVTISEKPIDELLPREKPTLLSRAD